MTWRLRWRSATARLAAPANARYAPEANAGGAGTDAADADWVDVGGLADLRHNRLVTELDGTSILVVRTGRALAAVENECPHLGQRLSDGDVSGRVIQCAAHGYRWDLGTGQPAGGLRVQRRRPLRSVPIRLAGDRILLAPAERPTPY
jgi:nitrite reductase/ring-hydroxylating ferredoxin subunit